ncbi:probable phospholipid-transporting ATPase 8 [Arachis duranensis]|uniref:Probable phospholipid-transporting ATPase 8 n=1 Tax=Arachis duranensis TaxID=130453 RepID=A0A6P4C989_ARADU|nr:probable phospholipid-transporting ATPase 8 [Arachis duranensis]
MNMTKSLFEQFMRVANFYFLVIGVLAMTKLAPYTAVSAIVPLWVIVGVTMVKEGIKDWRRKIQDEVVATPLKLQVIKAKVRARFSPKLTAATPVAISTKTIKETSSTTAKKLANFMIFVPIPGFKNPRKNDKLL